MTCRVQVRVQLQQWDLNPATYATATISKLCCSNTKPIQANVGVHKKRKLQLLSPTAPCSLQKGSFQA